MVAVVVVVVVVVVVMAVVVVVVLAAAAASAGVVVVVVAVVVVVVVVVLHCTRCSNVEALRRDRTMSRRLGGRSAFALRLYTTTISGPRALPKIANVIEDMRRGGAMAQMPVSPGLKDQHYKQHYE